MIDSLRVRDSLLALGAFAIRVVEPQTFTPGTTLLRGLTSLHFGDFGHLAVKWLYFILGMAGAFLFYSGNLLWVEARRNRRGATQTSYEYLAQTGTSATA